MNETPPKTGKPPHGPFGLSGTAQPQLLDSYLSRPAEQLVLEGYRGWTTSFINRSHEPLEETWNLYVMAFDGNHAQIAFDAFKRFIKTLGMCSGCPLKTHYSGSQNICRDEVMVLGLISALQHGDEEAAKLCLTHLACPSLCGDVENAACELAVTLRSLGQTLLPMPAHVIERLPEYDVHAFHDNKSKTLH